MADEKPKDDHDLLIGVAKTIELEFKNVKDQIKEIKDGTTDKIGDLYGKYNEMKEWRMAHEQVHKDDNRYTKLIILGVGLIFALLLWHITGGVAGFRI